MNKIRVIKNNFLHTLLNSFQICIYLLGIVLIIWIASKIGYSIGENTWPPTIDKIVNWSQIVIAYAAIFAIGQYAITYSDIADRKTKTVLEQVNFFRENVLKSADEAKSYLRSKKIILPNILLRKNTKFFEFNEKDCFNRIFPNQKILIDNYSSLILEDPKLESMIISCMNSIEEFSIGILNTNSQNHEAVSSVRKPFIEIVEQLAVPLYFHIGITADKFSYLSELYINWKKDIGFLPQTKEDRLDKFKEREKIYKR